MRWSIGAAEAVGALALAIILLAALAGWLPADSELVEGTLVAGGAFLLARCLFGRR
jgi:hypothetical protein